MLGTEVSILSAFLVLTTFLIAPIVVVLLFAKWCGGRGNGITPAPLPPKPQPDDRPRLINPRPSLESIEREMERNNAIDQRNRKRTKR